MWKKGETVKQLLFMAFCLTAALLSQTVNTTTPTLPANSPDTTINVAGKNFQQGSTVIWESTPLQTTFVSTTRLTAIVPSALLANVTGEFKLRVQAPASPPFTISVTGFTPFQSSQGAIAIDQVQGGPVARQAKLTFNKPWTAAVLDPEKAPWLSVGILSPLDMFYSLVGWRASSIAPGTYLATLRVTPATSETPLDIPVTYRVVPSLPPGATVYLSGSAPANCTQSQGYSDPELCQPPPLNFVPAKGVSYIDQTFGSSATILTEPGVNHTYSTPSPLSATAKYILVFKNNGTFDVRTTTGSTLTENVSTNQSAWWDADDDDAFYYVNGSQVVKHNVVANSKSIIMDYSGGPVKMTSILRGGTGDSSKDNWISFWAPVEGLACALDVKGLKTYCASYKTVPGLAIPNVDFTLISKGKDINTGKRYVIMSGYPSDITFSVNEAAGRLDFEYRGPEIALGNGNGDGNCDSGEQCLFGSHRDTLEVAGIQYLVENKNTNDPCEFAINTYQISKGRDIYKQVELGGGRRKAFVLWRCGPGWVDEHVACAKKAPACVISTQSVARPSIDTSPIVPTPHMSRLILMNGNGESFKSIAYTYATKFTDKGDQNYWAMPRASLSNDAKLAVFDTNYGMSTALASVTIVTTLGTQ